MDSLNLQFLGPKSEQRKLFLDMIELINNDVIFWRRNFHPKDPPGIAYKDIVSPSGLEFQENLIQNLNHLLAELKSGLPYFSPRYMAHMTSDTTLPSLLGYYAALLYNPNNVSGEVSTVTLKYELEVGREFAKLFGFEPKTSFGHITSGGTVANFESVFYNKASRFIPLEIALTFLSEKEKIPSFLPKSLWELCNIPLGNIPTLLEELKNFELIQSKVKENSLSELGEITFWNKAKNLFNDEINQPVMLVPSTAHYSWSKSANIFGIGRNNCLSIPLDSDLTMDEEELSRTLQKCLNSKTPILQTVFVLGSTEFGSFDKLHKLMPIVSNFNKLGLYTPIHLDAAYGGYFKTLFVEGNKSTKETIKNCKELNLIFNETKNVDSLTVDPHKLGRTPYGAGVFVTKHGYSKEFVAENAEYVLAAGLETDDNFPLGKYILEGSKPGASASSIYFSNKVLPLNIDGHGSLLYQNIIDTNIFYEKLKEIKSNDFEIKIIAKPSSNLLCFYLKPFNINNLSKINRFNEKLIEHYLPHKSNHIQNFDYFLSRTKLKKTKLTEKTQSEIFQGLEVDEESLSLLRFVFLSPWLNTENSSNLTYIDEFLSYISKTASEIINEN